MPNAKERHVMETGAKWNAFDTKIALVSYKNSKLRTEDITSYIEEHPGLNSGAPATPNARGNGRKSSLELRQGLSW